ncbi:hypothetical protein FIM12_05465 [SAR202 cluster bacterium AD-804-J14_MRT_500m]|nr:hypothetical protein [SAR202 cluster bacterium AD-804-J14_MRT_500m]
MINRGFITKRISTQALLTLIGSVFLITMIACGGSPSFGRTFQGQIIEVTLLEMSTTTEVFGLDNDDTRIRIITPSEIGNELLVLKLRVDNHAATQLHMDVGTEPPEIRDRDDSKYHPMPLAETIPYHFDRNGEPFPIPIIRGEYTLEKGYGVDGWLVFDVPEDTSNNIRSFRWGAGGDVIFIDF